MVDWTPDEAGARFDVSRESLDRLTEFVALLLRWQARINLIGPSTVGQVWHRHIADSLQLLPLLPRSAPAILDLGSGAGFPGLPLALVKGFEAHLVESSGKKSAFLREAIRHTGASAIVHQRRIETVNHAMVPDRIAAVTARALAPIPQLLDYAEPWLAAGVPGYFHKGQHVDAELTEATKSWKLTYVKHPSLTDPKAVILEIREAIRVGRSAQF
jgi:16S rRNA (guanine527-N7)-methyltransferase